MAVTPEIADVAKGFDAMMPEVRARFIEPPTRAPSLVTKAGATIGEPDPSTRTNQVTGDDYATAFTTLGAIDPVYDPEMLALLFEHSNSLRQNVDSMAVNVDGFGHRFDPMFDLASKDIDQRISDAMLTDRQRALDEVEEDTEAKPPTAEEVQAMKDKITRFMRIEKIRLTHFFEFCSPDTSFVTLRRRSRQDIEVTGNAYWEVLRNGAGQIVQFVYMPSFTVRLLPLDLEPLTVKSRVRVSELSFDEVEYTTRVRRYVQVVEGRCAFFKELGDARLVSSQSGMVFPDLETMKEREPGVRPANELIHFKIHSPRSPYGVPRWIGNLLAVIGSRQAEEVNFSYFENKSVPPLAILVSGGRMTQSSVDRVTNYIDANIKGKRNFHKILVLEAEAAGGGDARDSNASRMKIAIQPLTGAQHNDALFQNYDERNIDKVGQSFRLPRMLRGDIRDFNRATADAALTFAEMQVFEPERQEFDFIINRKILSMLGIRFWRYVSLAPVLRDPAAMSEIIKNLMNANVLTPEEARELAGDVFNREFKHIKAPWVTQPPAFTIAGIAPEAEPTSPLETTDQPAGDESAPAKPASDGIESRMRARLHAGARKQAMRLLEIRKALRLVEHDAWFEQFAASKAVDDEARDEGGKWTAGSGAGTTVRPKGWQAQSDAGLAHLQSIKREGHVYRGMTTEEYEATVGAGKGVKSTSRYSDPSEGSCFATDPADAEGYANFGRDDPRNSGKHTYLVEAKVAGTNLKKWPDGYFKAASVDAEHISRVWRMHADDAGGVSMTEMKRHAGKRLDSAAE